MLLHYICLHPPHPLTLSLSSSPSPLTVDQSNIIWLFLSFCSTSLVIFGGWGERDTLDMWIDLLGAIVAASVLIEDVHVLGLVFGSYVCSHGFCWGYWFFLLCHVGPPGTNCHPRAIEGGTHQTCSLCLLSVLWVFLCPGAFWGWRAPFESVIVVKGYCTDAGLDLPFVPVASWYQSKTAVTGLGRFLHSGSSAKSH